MRTLDRSDERAFARDDKILERIRISILRKEGVEKQQLIEIVCSRICSSFASRVFGSENEILSLVSTNFRSGESSLANKNLTKCISRNPPF
jgi:hypothetical protein